MIKNLRVTETTEDSITLQWEKDDADSYNIYWADANLPTTKFMMLQNTSATQVKIKKATHIYHYFKISSVKDGKESVTSEVVHSEIKKHFHPQLEKLSRGLVAAKTKDGIMLSWRLFLDETKGWSKTGMTGANFAVYKNGAKIAEVTDSTNFLDRAGTADDSYAVAVLPDGKPCEAVKAWKSGSNYIEIPMQIPEGGVTPSGEHFTYTVNDMSIGDIDGDGEYEYFVKWDPTNSHDVSQKGYTGRCFIDCYKLSGRLLWRLDMGVNIRAGAHYTQFMVFDFNGDGKAEMCVKTAPGTCMTFYNEDGSEAAKKFITLPERDIKKGITHEDNYVCSAAGYRAHIKELFKNWHTHPEVVRGQWPATLEECFGIAPKYEYPLSDGDAEKLVDYFFDVYAPSRSPRNELSKVEGFIYEGPEYLTMFAGSGEELETIDFPFPRVDDGLMWGDYAWNRIEPCNRVDRFLSGVAYLDGERPYVVVCRGYYTRACVAAYSFFDNHFKEKFITDSGFVPMKNPFKGSGEPLEGTSAKYGSLAGQGNHSLAAADIDGDGFHEIIYGAAAIDQDGSILYSSAAPMPGSNGKPVKFGHGDAMHTAKIDPDRPGLQTFNVFEGGSSVPWGYALRDAATGEVLFGEKADKDLGRCMIGALDPKRRGLQVWVDKTLTCTGEPTDLPLMGTNQSIRWAADMTTQILDGNDIFGNHEGVINDALRGAMLVPEGMATNNGTKGNPCLVADIFGDWREELILRKKDNSAIRIYTNTEITTHKLFTLMHDIQYRCGIAWQNNCYNQPCYTKFYFAPDTDWRYVLPELAED